MLLPLIILEKDDGAFVRAPTSDLGHKSAFDLLLKEAWNPELAALGNSTLLTVCDKLNVMSAIHLRKVIATLVRENGQRDAVIVSSVDRFQRHQALIRISHKVESLIKNDTTKAKYGKGNLKKAGTYTRVNNHILQENTHEYKGRY